MGGYQLPKVRRPLPACSVCHSPTSNFASGVCSGCHHKKEVGRELAEAEIVAFLRQGGERTNGVWYSWDSEMCGYANSFADRIENGDHRS